MSKASFQKMRDDHAEVRDKLIDVLADRVNAGMLWHISLMIFRQINQQTPRIMRSKIVRISFYREEGL